MDEYSGLAAQNSLLKMTVFPSLYMIICVKGEMEGLSWSIILQLQGKLKKKINKIRKVIDLNDFWFPNTMGTAVII